MPNWHPKFVGWAAHAYRAAVERDPEGLSPWMRMVERMTERGKASALAAKKEVDAAAAEATTAEKQGANVAEEGVAAVAAVAVGEQGGGPDDDNPREEE